MKAEMNDHTQEGRGSSTHLVPMAAVTAAFVYVLNALNAPV